MNETFFNSLLLYYSCLKNCKKNYIKLLYKLLIQFIQFQEKKTQRYQIVCETLKSQVYSELIKEQDGKNSIQGTFGISVRHEETKIQDNNKINSNNFLIGEKLKIELKKQIYVLLENLKDFWQKLIDGYIDLESYMLAIINIINQIIKTKKKLVDAVTKFQDSPNFLKLTSFFTAFIENNIIEGLNYENKLRAFMEKDLLHGSNVINTISILNKQITCIIATFLTDMGHIIMNSDSTASIFKYTSTEFIILKNINQIMPQIISANHNNYIKRKLHTGHSNIIQQLREIRFLCKNGLIFPGKIIINYFFSFNTDYCYQALILKLISSSTHLILDSKGMIQNIDKKFIKNILGVKSIQNVNTQDMINLMHQTHISLFIPQFYKFVDNFIQNHPEKKNPTNCTLISTISKQIAQLFNYEDIEMVIDSFKNHFGRAEKIQNEKNEQFDYQFYRQTVQKFWDSIIIYQKQTQFFSKKCFQISVNITREIHYFNHMDIDTLQFYCCDIQDFILIKEKENTPYKLIVQNIIQYVATLKKQNISSAITQEKKHLLQFKIETQQNDENRFLSNFSQDDKGSATSIDSKQPFDSQQEVALQSDTTFKVNNQEKIYTDSNYNYLNLILSQLRVPLVVKTLYFFYIFTIITFLIMLGLYWDKIGQFTNQSSNHQDLSITKQQIIIPLNQIQIYYNYVTIQNNIGKQIPTDRQTFIQNQIQYYFDKIKVALYHQFNSKTGSISSDTLLGLQITIQQKLQDTKEKFSILFLQHTRIQLQSYLKLLDEILQIQSFDESNMFYILDNYNPSNVQWEIYFNQIDEQIDFDFQNFKKRNYENLIYSIVVVVFSLILTIPAYLSYKSKLQRLLLITTRISQKEAEVQISIVNYLLQLFTDQEEVYLKTDMHPDDWLSEQKTQLYESQKSTPNIPQRRQTKENRQNRKRSTTKYLQFRILNPKLNTVNFIILIMFIALVCTGFFLGIYYYNTELYKYLMNAFPLFKSFTANGYYLSQIFMIDQLIQYGKYLDFQKAAPSFYSQQGDFNSLKNELFSKVDQFYYVDYLDLILEPSTENSIKSLLQEQNQSSICDFLKNNQDILRFGDLFSQCSIINNQILQRGMLPSINKQLVAIGNDNQNASSVTNNELLSYLQGDYLWENIMTNEFLISSIYQVFFNFQITLQFKDILTAQVQDFVKLMQYMLALLVLIMLSIFCLFYYFYFKKLESNYLKVFKSLRLIPFSKFSDETLRNLIKQSII